MSHGPLRIGSTFLLLILAGCRPGAAAASFGEVVRRLAWEVVDLLDELAGWP